MHPFLFNSIPLYFVMWACAIAVTLIAGTRMAARAGFPAGRSALVLASAVLAILVGSKALYLLEARFFPYDDYVPLRLRGALHGFRISRRHTRFGGDAPAGVPRARPAVAAPR